jgi:hypothetical protein
LLVSPTVTSATKSILRRADNFVGIVIKLGIEGSILHIPLNICIDITIIVSMIATATAIATAIATI